MTKEENVPMDFTAAVKWIKLAIMQARANAARPTNDEPTH